MSLYCLVKNGAVVEGPIELPKNWRNGKDYLMCLNDAPSKQLKALGWYPAVVTEPVYSQNSHKKGVQKNTVNANDVLVTWAVVPLTSKEGWDNWNVEMIRLRKGLPAFGEALLDHLNVSDFNALPLEVKDLHAKLKAHIAAEPQ